MVRNSIGESDEDEERKVKILYLGALVVANLLVARFGPDFSIVTAFFFVGLNFYCRDALHERWHNQHLVRNMAMLIGSASLLSFVLALVLNNGNLPPDVVLRIGIASLVALAVSEGFDAYVYHKLFKLPKFQKRNGSNLVSSAIDSGVFPIIAFGFPLLVPVMVGQFLAKVGGGFLWSLILSKR
jgi:uncharacterized PurR-regulated membrane protein YhhQ (DUF165 family)